MTETSLGVGESLFEGPTFEGLTSEKAPPRRVPPAQAHINKMIILLCNSFNNSYMNQGLIFVEQVMSNK